MRQALNKYDDGGERREMAIFERAEDGPPEDRAGDEETQVLEDVQAVVCERGVEQHGNVPGQHRADAEQPGDGRLAEDAFQFSEARQARTAGVPSSSSGGITSASRKCWATWALKRYRSARVSMGRDEIEEKQEKRPPGSKARGEIRVCGRVAK